MLNLIGDLSEISADRHTLLTEVFQWMQRYPANSYLHFRDTPSADMEEYQFVDEANLFTDWDVKKKIRRLSVISEELGLVKLDDKQEKGDDKRKLLEEKMNKQKSRFVAMKVFDGMLLQ